MSKIVLINPVNLDPPPNYFGPPYGLSLIAANLLKCNKKVTAYDFDFQPMPVMLQAIPEILKKDKPDYIGIATQSCARGSVYQIIRAIKKNDNKVKIILGGPFASLKFELLLRNFAVDFVIIGDGEITLNQLIDCIDNKDNLSDVDGIAYIGSGKLCVTQEREKISNLDQLLYPAFHLFKDFNERMAFPKNLGPLPNFLLGKRCTTLKDALLMLSSRGCIYSCNFCPMSKITKHKIRFHSPEYFVNMVEYFHEKYSISDFVFGDNFFTLRKERVLKICELILQKKLKIKWGCMTRSDYVDEEMLSIMAKAGCFEISYGVESGSVLIQKKIGKNLDLAKTKESFLMTEKFGIRSVLMLMIGNSGENVNTIKQTMKFVRGMRPDSILVKKVKVYPGTKIHDIFEQKGLIDDNYYLGDDYHPPTFTLAHSQNKLNDFSDMIKSRRVYIDSTNVSNNNSLFSDLDSGLRDKDLDTIKKELALALTRAELVVLTGGEFFLRKDFFDILRFAIDLNLHHLYIKSNARIFLYNKFLEKLMNIECLEKILVPFYGEEAYHDQVCRVKGAFSQTVKGIKNLKLRFPYIKVQAQIPILLNNFERIQDLTVMLSNMGVDEFHYLFGRSCDGITKVSPNNLPLISKAMKSIATASKWLVKKNKEISFEGVPLCIAGKYKYYCCDFTQPFDEVITFDNKVVGCIELRKKYKKKYFFCRKCKEGDLCEGVWRNYAKIAKSDELKPY